MWCFCLVSSCCASAACVALLVTIGDPATTNSWLKGLYVYRQCTYMSWDSQKHWGLSITWLQQLSYWQVHNGCKIQVWVYDCMAQYFETVLLTHDPFSSSTQHIMATRIHPVASNLPSLVPPTCELHILFEGGRLQFMSRDLYVQLLFKGLRTIWNLVSISINMGHVLMCFDVDICLCLIYKSKTQQISQPIPGEGDILGIVR